MREVEDSEHQLAAGRRDDGKRVVGPLDEVNLLTPLARFKTGVADTGIILKRNNTVKQLRAARNRTPSLNLNQRAVFVLPHPGEILLEEFLKPMGLSQNALARAIHVPPRRINEIVLAKRAVTADTDLRLARYFGVSEGFFLGLQTDYDLMERRRQIGRDLNIIKPRAA